MQVNHANQQRLHHFSDEPQTQAGGVQGRPGAYASSSGRIDATPAPAGNPRVARLPADSPLAADPGPTPSFTIFGTNNASPPQPGYSLPQREQRVAAYAGRVKAQIANVESGGEAERNVKFLNARPFTTPSGYFSGGLLAAGYDPGEEIRGTFVSHVGKGHPEKQTGSSARTYKAWEIAAGALAHDRPEQGGIVNFQSLHIDPAQQARVSDLESIGKSLQDRWQQEVATPMRDASGTLAARSGKADAYSAQATLQSLRADQAAFGRLSAEGRQAISRTLDHAGQVIIPNVYGYPLAGHAFVPYTPYDGNYENRPNQGLLVDLNQGTVSEIKGDKDFAKWAQRNRENLNQSFNASDRQGGLDAHWPRADEVLDNLIAGNKVTYPGYRNLVSDQRIPVGELFNYTRSRGSDYQLKYGDLKADGSGIASQYGAVNAKNAAWADQTQVFGSAEQNWKSARGIWNNTFGYAPVLGNAGNIVFGAHDSLHGMTAKDRIGGNVAAAISGLQLMHELAPGVAAGAAGAVGKAPAVVDSVAAHDGGWKFNPKTSEFRFAPPQRVNGQIGYPMSPMEPPRIGGGDRPGLPEQGHGGVSAGEHVEPEASAPSTDRPHGEPVVAQAEARVPAHVDSGDRNPGANEPPPHEAANDPGANEAVAREKSISSSRNRIDADDRPATPGSGKRKSSSENRHLRRSGSTESLIPSSRADSIPSIVASPADSPPVNPEAAPRRASGQSSAASVNQAVIPLSPGEDAGFKKHFPGGLDQAESWLKGKALGMRRSPAYLSSDQYSAPQSWSGISQEEKNRLMERYLSVWDPAPKRADYGTVEEFTSEYNAYGERMDKFKENGNFNIPAYWDDLIASQNGKFKAEVDNQTKRLAVATKAYDDFMANPTAYRVKPDDPYPIRKQMTGKQNGKRDAMFLQREALNFGSDQFYKLDGKNISELKSSFLGLFGRDDSKIEGAFLHKKNSLEDELYRYAGSGVSRDMVDEKKKSLQARFNGDIDIATKNMDLMYKRIALYGTLGTLSISAVSALLWKAIDEIRRDA